MDLIYMEKKLNILAIEDLEDDLFLLLRYLKKNGFIITHTRVDNEVDLREALNADGWDIIISDYSMPQFTGLKALEIFKEYKIDIPFILLSGTIGEEIAVEAMKKGAHDYIMKDKLSRLIPAIERELKESKIRRERTEAINKLKESEGNYKSLVENALDIIFVVSKDGVVTSANNATKRILNIEKENLIGKHFKEIVHPDDFDYVLERLQGTLLGKSKGEYEVRIKKQDNSYIIGGLKTTLLVVGGETKGVLGFIRDLTKSKEMEERITIFSKASNQSPVSIIITDLNGEVSYINDKYLEDSEYTKDEVFQEESKKIIASEVAHDDYKKMWLDVKNYGSWSGEYYSKTKNGKLYWEEVSITPIKDEKGEIIRYLVIKNDITKRKELISEILVAKKDAEAANNLKSEFLAQMSHEIRTPLNTMLSFHQLFQAEIGDKLDEDLRSCLVGAESASQRIIRTIDLLLNMTELQVGSYTPNRLELDLYDDILDRLLLEKLPECKRKGIELTLSKSTEDTTMFADEYSVTQIFDNIISNAIKYTNKGSVEINCYRNESGRLSISVKDTGIGIAKKNLTTVFDAFAQEEQGYTRSYEGNGLGLALVKEYCKLNRASISVESEKGVGSTFTITFIF
jgi:PAS domain S-box-containing protein